MHTLVDASSPKFNFRRYLRWVAKWTRNFSCKYMQNSQKNHFKAALYVRILFFIDL